jgi:hypothetical protein
LNKLYGFLILVAVAIAIGCGGGGGGSTTGSTDGTTDGTTDGGTTGVDTGLYGKITDSVGNPLASLTVKFYTSGGALVGSSTTNGSGNFGANLPTNASFFTVDLSTMAEGANYFNQFTYNGEDYLANDTSCLAKAPAFSAGQAKSLGTLSFTPRWLGPPAPPTGCLAG